MLGFERRLTSAMVAHLPDDERDQVMAFVATSLRSMPDHLRVPVAAVSVVLGMWARILAMGRTPRVELRPLAASRLGPIRQYARLMRSLVLFAEHEVRPGGAG